jgi:hypothetical protein
VALFVLLGLIGWQLPQLGGAVLAYSNKAVNAARATFTSAQPEKASLPQVANTSTTTPAVAITTSAAADTPGQQAVAQARTQVAAARAALRSGAPDKAKQQALEAALQNLKTAAALRISEIRAELNAASQNSGNSTAKNDSGSGGSQPANYDALVGELKTLGFFDNSPTVAPTNEVEPNDTSATGTSLGSFAAGGLKIGAGQIAAGNVDFWKLEGVPAGAKVWAFIDTGGTQGTGGTSRDSVMDLFDTNGTTILESDDDGATATGCDTTIESLAASAIANRTLTAGGTYFISVDTFGATATINPYKLFVVVTTTSSAEVESNNTPALADSITPSADAGRVRTGSIGAAGDIDFYSVVVPAGATLHVNADGDPERDASSTDVVVDVMDTNGTTVLLTADGSPSIFGVGPDSEATCITLATAGTYFIRVTHFSATGTGTYALMAGLSAAPTGGPQVCPPIPIASSLGVAGGNFPKVSGTQTQRLFRDGVQSACGVARTQAAPIAGTFTFDKYTFTNSAAATKCITVNLRVVEQAASNYMVGAFSVFVPTNLTSGWLGDPGLSSGIPPALSSFSVNIAAGASFDVVVFNTNTTGNGNPYELTVFGFDGCVVPACGLTCPANITVSNAANQCGATVTFPAPATTGLCSTVTCVPASGSFFPKGTTTVTCTGTSPGNPNATCSFTVTVNDTQPPAITCPPSFAVGTTGNTAVVNYAAPTASDNCPGIQAVTCVPASGSSFPVGVTTVTCTVRDAVNNSATCSFQVTVNRVGAPSITDPLACTGPGNALTGTFSLSNNGAASIAATATVSMPLAGAGIPGIAPGTPLLVALPGSCVASIGSCSVTSPTTISYTGTLGVGQTATISYQVQVNDGVPTGTPMTVTTAASFGGGPPLTVGTTVTTTCPAIGPGPEIPARSEVSDQKPGSILFYPIYTSAVGQNNQNSRIAITNTHQTLNAFVHLFFVADNCAVSDAFICLTPNQTSVFLASDMDPGTTGYLVAVAVNGRTGCPVNFNYLIGDEYVKFASGHSANLSAEGIGAIAGGLPACNTNSILANLRFDGVSYNRLPTTLALDNLGSRADGNDTMLILNSIGGDLRTGPNTLTSIFGVLYDDSEAAFSFTISSSQCQFRTSINNSLPRTTPRFDQVIPAGRVGWIRLWHRTTAPILGAAINFNSNTAASSGAFTGGHNLHKLTLTDTGVYTVPVFPPTC